MSRVESVVDRQTRRKAKRVARYAGQTVGIGNDSSLTIGNVTFGKSEHDLMLPQDILPVVWFYSDENVKKEGFEPGHVYRGSSPSQEPGFEGWRDSVQRPMEKPTEFAETFDPPGKVARITRYIVEAQWLVDAMDRIAPSYD
jgi:hypothetical protein